MSAVVTDVGAVCREFAALCQVGIAEGVTVNELATLTVLYEVGEPVQMTELAKLRGFSTAGATTAADCLERKGLAAREHGREDRRSVYVKLTPEGAGFLENLVLLSGPAEAGARKKGGRDE